MSEDEKVKEWIHINRSILEAYEIFVFLLATEDNLTKQKDKIILFDHLTDLFYFFSNIGRVHAISEMGKIIDPDGKSVSLFSFINKFFKKENEIFSEFSKWKKDTKKIRKIIIDARNRFSAHIDSDSFHQDENFGLYIEDVDIFLKKTINFLDFLYERDRVLKINFDQQVCPASPRGEKPSDAAKSWKTIMENRIKYLQDNYKNSGINFPLKS